MDLRGKIPPLVTIILALAHLLMGVRPLKAVTAEDFGFGSLRANGQPIIGTIPLLVVIYELSTNGSTRQLLDTNLTADMDRLIFNFFAFPSVNGYFLENSSGAFSWQRAATLGPLKLDATETATLYSQQSDDDGDGTNEGPLDSRAGFRYLLGLVVAKTGYNFAQWDSNGDGSITQDELSILVMGNNNLRAGANRPIGSGGLMWPVPGQNVTVNGQLASLDHRASFMTIAHELSHSLGTADLYGSSCFNSGVSLMTCTIFNVDNDRRTYHLDPWHKMRLGWLRPRIFTLGEGGLTTVAASQIISANTPVLLYDPARGASDYFLIEFRNNRLPNGTDHDANLTDASTATPFTDAASGMAVWHVNAGTVNHEGAPMNQVGGSALWNVPTPLLRWGDGSATGTRLNPVSVINGGREMVLEWFTLSEMWIDFAFNGALENGSFANPFNTLTEGVAAAPRGATLKIKTGSTSTTISINKRLNLEAVGGPVVIGR